MPPCKVSAYTTASDGQPSTCRCASPFGIESCACVQRSVDGLRQDSHALHRRATFAAGLAKVTALNSVDAGLMRCLSVRPDYCCNNLGVLSLGIMGSCSARWERMNGPSSDRAGGPTNSVSGRNLSRTDRMAPDGRESQAVVASGEAGEAMPVGGESLNRNPDP